MKNNKKELLSEQSKELLKTLKNRFEKNLHRHKGLEWVAIQSKLEANKEKHWTLNEMEITGGEPDVVGYDNKPGEYIFYDCSAESPKGRRSVCFDHEVLEKWKENKQQTAGVRWQQIWAFDGSAIQGVAVPPNDGTKFRYKNIKLDSNTC